MESRKLLVFDISGEYGHFRKFNTTSSPLTYSIPTHTALAGILGAIIGIEREVSANVFPDGVIPVNEVFSRDKAKFAIQILNPINDKVAEGIRLVNHHFTPYLGLSQFTALVEWLGIENISIKDLEEDFIEIHTAVNLSKLTVAAPIRFEKAFYSTDTMPMAMRRDRVITEYAEILIERKGSSIWVNTPNYLETKFGNILFL